MGSFGKEPWGRASRLVCISKLPGLTAAGGWWWWPPWPSGGPGAFVPFHACPLMGCRAEPAACLARSPSAEAAAATMAGANTACGAGGLLA